MAKRLGDTMVKQDALKNHLESLRNSITELRGVLLASNEGLPVAHSLSNGTDPNRVAAMAAAASGLGRRISESMATGVLSEVSIRGDGSHGFKCGLDPSGSAWDSQGNRRSVLVGARPSLVACPPWGHADDKVESSARSKARLRHYCTHPFRSTSISLSRGAKLTRAH